MTEITSKNNQIIIYQSNDGQISFNVNVLDETVWLTQKQMAELFDKNRKTITEHIGNIFKEGELEENSVCRNFQHTASDGKKYSTKYYNLDVIISVGYRVKSQRGTQFRQWATQILKQYMMNGYVINDPRVDMILEYITQFKSEYKDDQKKLYEKIAEIANKQITIHNHNYNQISLTGNKLEDKIIDLIDEIISQLRTEDKIKTQLEETKEVIKASPKDEKAKNKILKFFNKLGDDKSDLHKTIKGAGIAKKVITELIKLGEKLKDLIS